MSSRLNTKLVVNAYFAQSGYMKPGSNFWKSLNFESKQKFRGFVNAARAKIGEGTAEEQVAAFASLVLPDLSSNVAKVWAADPKLKQFLTSKLPPLAEAPQLPVKGASEPGVQKCGRIQKCNPERNLQEIFREITQFPQFHPGKGKQRQREHNYIAPCSNSVPRL